MDQNDKDKLAELNEQETEQVVGGGSPNPTVAGGRTLTNSNNPFGGLDALRRGSTHRPAYE